MAEESALRRQRLLPLLAAGTRDADAGVRAAAAVALARAGGESGLADLEACFADASPTVRRAAILALGATGSERAVHRLLRIAAGEPSSGADAITPRARSLAVVALGIARQRGAGRHIAAFLPPLAAARGPIEEDALGSALFFHHSLAPAGELEPLARRLSGLFGSAGESLPRCLVMRAAEALRHEAARDPLVLERVIDSLGTRDLDLRRSLALTAGALEADATAPSLRRALGREREYLTRGFLLLALGRNGGAGTRDELVDLLAGGDRAGRPWVALALGILAGRADDDVARQALREELARERSAEAIGAFLLAAGIARDRQAVGRMEQTLRDGASGRQRLHAALALSMSGHPSAAPVLRRALASERSPYVRIVVAQALARLGEDQDAPALLAVLAAVHDADLQAQIAAALGSHGTLPMLRGLADELEAADLDAVGRAAAMQAIGILLDPGEPFAMTRLCQGKNFTVFPDWIYEPVLTTL
ncbi:MAG: HEAT repeat domain-containing protein [Planctomycetota bacterium]